MNNTVPEGWKESSIGEITATNSLFSDGDWVESKDQDQSGSNRLIQLADIGDGVFINKSSRFMNDEQFERLKCTELKRGDVLIARMPDPLGRACLYPLEGKRSATVVDVAILRTENADHYWLMSAINSSEFRYQIDLNASGTTRTRIGRGVLSEIKVLEPPLPEQQKIAAILSSVDDVIEKTQAQINKLKDLKTGMMQELLTKGIGHTEFKDSPVGRIPAGWDVVQYKHVLEKIDSGWSPNCIETPPNTGEWGVLKVSAVTRGRFLENESKTLPENLAPRVKLRVARGDVLLTRANGVAELVGKCVMVEHDPKSKLMMSDKILRLNPNKRIDPYFLLHTFNSQANRKQIELSWGGSSGQKNISQTDIKDYWLGLPPIEEQQKIGRSISSVEELMFAKEKKLSALNCTKKALMQDLLTGNIRVNPDMEYLPNVQQA